MKAAFAVDELADVAVSPDGKEIAYVGGHKEEQSAWLLENFLPPKQGKATPREEVDDASALFRYQRLSPRTAERRVTTRDIVGASSDRRRRCPACRRAGRPRSGGNPLAHRDPLGRT